LLGIAAASCAAPPEDARVTVASLDAAAYGALVHHVIERDCGSAACHGNAPRGLRVYGSASLRLPNQAQDSQKTTEAEARATYQSIVGLEPEKMNDFLAGRTPDGAYHLLVLAKPLATERHRGGISLRKGEPAEECIFSWLLGAVNAEACAK